MQDFIICWHQHPSFCHVLKTTIPLRRKVATARIGFKA
jgi:hypothetical protein